MSVYKRIGSGGLALVSMACTAPPKDAVPLTNDERAAIELDLARYEQIRPVIESFWKASAIDYGNEFEYEDHLSSGRILQESADHFSFMLKEERIFTLQSAPEEVATAQAYAVNHSKKNDVKDYMVFFQDWKRSTGGWRVDTYLHEATHSLQSVDLPDHFEYGHPDYDYSSDTWVEDVIEAKDMPTTVGVFVDYSERILEWGVLDTEDLVHDGTYSEFQEADAERFAQLGAEHYGDSLEEFGVTKEEVTRVLREHAEYLKELQRERKAEWDLESEAATEVRRSEGGPGARR